MIVAITGTPATGKTSASRVLSEMIGWELVSLNDLAEKKGMHSGYDEERCCKIADMKAIKAEVEKLKKTGNPLIVESHYAHDMHSDLVIVLRTNPSEMRKRGKEKGWDFNKTEENVLAEIMEECKIESIESGKAVREIDTTGKTAEQSAKEMAKVMEMEGLFITGELKIPDNMREELREPYGKLFDDHKKAAKEMKGTKIVSVGDETAYKLDSHGVRPDIIVVDGKVKRKPAENTVKFDGEVITAKNPTGYLTNDMWMAVRKSMAAKKPVEVRIDGEEDMAVLPAAILGENGISVTYGLFDKGVCVVKIDDSTRKTARNVLKRIAASQ